jgi:predicted RNA binding protein YcfA (HicA-like mRNA interferase family)
MSSHGFSDITQSRWIKAYQKLGLLVDYGFGKGSHVRIEHPQTKAKYTVQRNLHKFINMKIFKKMLEWGFDEEKIWNALK